MATATATIVERLERFHGIYADGLAALAQALRT